MFEIDPRAEEIDSLRESNPVYALAEAEHWVRELCRKGPRRRSVADAVRLATSLGVWGSTLRARGRFHLAAQALELALKLHGDATSSATYADLLERAAIVVKKFGYLEPAHDLLQRTLGIFSAVGNEPRQARTLLALGLVHAYLDNRPLAELFFNRAIHSPNARLITRAGAVGNLAILYEKNSDFERAEATLDVLDRARESLPYMWDIQLNAIRARLLARRGDLQAAAVLFGESLELCWKGFPPERSFLLFLDFAVILVQMEELEKLEEIARIQGSLLTLLEDTPRSRLIASAFIESILESNSMESEVIEDVAARFVEALKRDRQSGSSNYPTGSIQG